VRGLLFDLDDTLIDRAGALERWLARHPLLAGDERARARLRQLDDHGYRDRDEFCRAAVAEFPWLAPTSTAFWRDFSTGIAACVEPRSTVNTLIELLLREYSIAIISNGSSINQRTKMQRAHLDLPIIVSGEVGCEKPDPRIFTRALAQIDCRADEALYSGDDPERDIAGAHAVGLATCWIAHGREWPLTHVHPTYTIPTIDQFSVEKFAFVEART
jgi:putative hydrolase of the HAD superfamily